MSLPGRHEVPAVGVCTPFVVAALLTAVARAVAQTPASTSGPAIIRSARQAVARDPVEGLWAAETTIGPALHGVLTVRRDGARWRAWLGGTDSEVEEDAVEGDAGAGDSVQFVVPGHRGSFRGTVRDAGRTIAGFWVQPARVTDGPPDATGAGQRFASPVILRRPPGGRRETGAVWRGPVLPLADRFTLYLAVSRAADGGLVAAFRNPEYNARGGAAQFRVTRVGDSVRFRAQPDTSRPEVRLSAAVVTSAHGAPATLRIAWPDLGRVLTLTRATPAQTAAFFPRAPSAPPYAYDTPATTGDGWVTARAHDVGLDEAALTRLVRQIIRTDPADVRPALIHSVLIARHGRLVLDEYFFGFDRDRPHDLRSAAKTFASVMLGTAVREGTAIAPATPLYALLTRGGPGGSPEPGPFAHPDPRKAQITLAHLLTHTSGLACDDADDRSPGNEDTMQAQHTQPDWWRYTLDLPMAHDPGVRYAYCSAGMNLVGAALTTATGTWLPAFFDRTVARPLDFGPYHWNLMPTGEGYLGGGAYVRARDLLKLGQAYLDGGVWRAETPHARRLVDAAWVAQTTAPRVAVSPASTGLDSVRFRDAYRASVDGYAWHRYSLRAGDRTYDEYEASGNGGQLLIVVPALDLAVVFTAGNYGQGGIWGRWRDEIVAGQIIPAIVR